jgi:hypothetical protein
MKLGGPLTEGACGRRDLRLSQASVARQRQALYTNAKVGNARTSAAQPVDPAPS